MTLGHIQTSGSDSFLRPREGLRSWFHELKNTQVYTFFTKHRLNRGLWLRVVCNVELGGCLNGPGLDCSSEQAALSGSALCPGHGPSRVAACRLRWWSRAAPVPAVTTPHPPMSSAHWPQVHYKALSHCHFLRSQSTDLRGDRSGHLRAGSDYRASGAEEASPTSSSSHQRVHPSPCL